MTTTRTTVTALLGAATLATGLTLAAPAYAGGGDDNGGQSGHGGHGGDDHGGGNGGSSGGGHSGSGHQSVPQSRIPLPNGFQPEGIATGKRHTAYLGSLADGDIYALDLRSGEGEVISQGPGTPSVGLKLDHDRLFVAGGPSGTARVVDVRSGDVLASLTLVAAGTPSFINDVVLTEDAAWFTDSSDNAIYKVALDEHGHGHHGDDDSSDGSWHGHDVGDDHGHHGAGHQRSGGGHHGHHGHHSVPTQADVTKVDLTGAWVQGTGFNANGISTTPDGSALLVVNSSNGVLYRVGEDGVATVVDLGGATLTNGDGMLREGRTLYVVQNQLNQVAVLRLAKDGSSAMLVDTLTSPDFDTPTTIARANGDLYLPNARFTTPPSATTEYWVTGIDD